MQTLLKNHLYCWSGTTSQQKKISGEIHAFSPNLAKIQLKEQGITVNFIKRRKLILAWRQKKLSSTDMTFFFRQLATLIAAGVPLLQSFSILLESHAHSPHFISLMQTLKKDIASGKPLAKALRVHKKDFDKLTCQLIHIAEQTGTLAHTLSRVANHKEKQLSLKSKICQALLYPAIIFLTAILITAIMLIYVIPQFAELFANFHGKLPALTLFIIHFSTVLRHRYWLALFPITGGALFCVYYSKSPFLKKLTDQSLLRVPVLRHIITQFIFARFTRTFATVLAAGLTVPEALSLIIDIIPSPTFKTAIAKLQQDIIAGQQLYSAMRERQWFPRLLIQMVKVGEESGSLELMLEKVAEFYEAEIDYWVHKFQSFIRTLDYNNSWCFNRRTGNCHVFTNF